MSACSLEEQSWWTRVVQHAAEQLVTPDCMKSFIPLQGCWASEAMVWVCPTQSLNAAMLVSCFPLMHFDVLIAYCMSSMHAAVVCLTLVHVINNVTQLFNKLKVV